jgi:transposase
MSKQRRHFTGTEKVAILKKHLVENVPVSKLCEDHDLYPTQFYTWLKEFFENGHLAFDNDRKAKAAENAKDHKIEQLEAKLQRKDSVLAELMEEHISLKKELGEI